MGEHFHGIPEMNSLGVLVGILTGGPRFSTGMSSSASASVGRLYSFPQPGMLRAKTSISDEGP